VQNLEGFPAELGYNSAVAEIVRLALAEDIGRGDITTEATISAAASAKAVIVQKQPGVLCGLPVARRARIIALNVLEVPLEHELGDHLGEVEDLANAELDEAAAIGDSYGVRVLTRLERAHAAGPAIVAEADARNAEIIVLGSPRKRMSAGESAVFGSTVDYVLKHAHCRVMVTAA
jgi:nucleotide-binding universal stress UspA family protein